MSSLPIRRPSTGPPRAIVSRGRVPRLVGAAGPAIVVR
jgi:hypothetical protein